MEDAPASSHVHEIVCPHCRNVFHAELLTGGSDRHAGFKCPHCRLFVAYDRVRAEEGERNSEPGG
jgi:hypothetical protein